ncbi:serine protease inhibitor Kazal-type 8 [Acomys russatus]|uniref:serine protease inhibitor Kazal-type 8 n=1 Tax=Acomys russatus TaxID=60746 RepID=UPI0021E22B43|nr:serine protease inhibitor Kazal-type 8 [Acomys russatus]
MKATFSVAVLALAISAWTSFAVDFPLPVSFSMTMDVLQETKALCRKNVRNCWILSYFSPSEPICGTDQVTYGGECHLCYLIL